jgi:hypothetical protein
MTITERDAKDFDGRLEIDTSDRHAMSAKLTMTPSHGLRVTCNRP